MVDLPELLRRALYGDEPAGGVLGSMREAALQSRTPEETASRADPATALTPDMVANYFMRMPEMAAVAAASSVAKGILSDAVRGLAAPGRAMRGEYGAAGDPQFIERSLEDVRGLANTGMFVGGLGRAPPGSLGMFVPASPTQVNLARMMQAQGRSPEHIWKGARVWLDPPTYGKLPAVPLTEIPDFAAQVSSGMRGLMEQGQTVPLRYLMPHPELYAQKPWVGNISVSTDPTLPSGVTGTTAIWAQPATTLQGVTGTQMSRAAIEMAPGLSADKFKETLLHEIQHPIQAATGMPQGSSRAEQYSTGNPMWDIYNARKAEILTPLPYDQYVARGGLPGAKQYAEYKNRMANAQLPPDIDKYLKERSAHQAYELNAGEALARNVPIRAKMSPKELAANPPWTTFDPGGALHKQFVWEPPFIPIPGY